MTKICIKCNREWNVSIKCADVPYICPDCEDSKIYHDHVKTLISKPRKASKDVFRSVLLKNKRKWGNRIG